MITNVARQADHSVELFASPAFAWTYMTDVKNWDDPPARFRLEGAFAAGGRGTTEMPGQPPRRWQLRSVHPIESYTIELSFDGAILSFAWRFAGLSDGGTRLTQQITLEAENSSAYVAEVQRAFTSTLEAGMRRVAQAIDQAY